MLVELAEVSLALVLLQFTGPTGGRIDVNREAISSIRDPANMTGGHFGKGTHCVLILTNGHAIAIGETCDEVRAALGERTGPCTLVCGQAPPK